MAGVINFGQVSLWPLADARNARAFTGLRTHNLNSRILFFEVTRHARDGAGGAHGAHKVRDLAARVLPDLGAGGLVVNARVVHVGKLVQHPALAFGLHAIGQVTRAFHAAGLGREDELCTKSLHGLRTLNGQVLRHDEHHAVALDGGCHGQRNAGVAGGRFNQGVTGLDITALFSAPDH